MSALGARIDGRVTTGAIEIHYRVEGDGPDRAGADKPRRDHRGDGPGVRTG